MLGLNVGIPSELMRIDPLSSHGRIWSTVPELIKAMALATTIGPTDLNGEWRPDVWLSCGHFDPLRVAEPVVSVVYEARWANPELAVDLHPSFLAWIEPNTADAVRSAARLITLSFAAAANLARLGADPERIDVVPLGVDLDRFRPGITGGREIVAQTAADDRPYIVSLATLFRGKNLLLLREAVARLVDRGFPHRLVLIIGPPGDGSDLSAARAEILSPAVRFGNAPVLLQRLSDTELAAVMAGAAAFCLPSRFEGFGMPALEALACGVPTIVSNRGALPEVVGDAGLIVEPHVQAIESALAEVLTNAKLAVTLAINGRKRAEKFTWERTARGWVAALEEAAAENRGSS